jgi:uncharacterized protein YegL
MEGDPINQLNLGLERLAEDIKENPLARKRTELSVVTFGGRVDVVTPFQEAQFSIAPRLTAGGGTPLGHAISVALDQLAQQKSAYKANGLEYFRPWIIVMSDGSPTDNTKNAVRDLQELQSRRGVTVFPIGVGDQADISFLSTLSTERPAVSLRDVTSFSEFFLWLSASLGQVSTSNTQVSSDTGLQSSAQVALPSPEGWMKA